MWKSSGELKIALYKDFIERLKDWKTDFVKKQEVEKK
jgi:methionine salvage enolase-phosphatase E1